MSQKKSSQIKVFIIIIAAIGLGIAGKLVYDQQVAGAEFNKLIQLANDGEHKAAVDGFENLMKTAPSNIVEKAKVEAADLYLLLGGEPATTFAEAAQYFRRAEELRPGSLNEAQKKHVESANKVN